MRSVEKVRIKNRRWREKNKEKERARVLKWQKDNKEKTVAKTLRWARKNPEKVKDYSTTYRRDKSKIMDIGLRYKYGITLDQYNKMLLEQNGVCYICQNQEALQINGEVRKLVVDHDHETGQIRGLLCDLCNRGIGSFKENIQSLDRAKEYLEKFKQGGGKV